MIPLPHVEESLKFIRNTQAEELKPDCFVRDGLNVRASRLNVRIDPYFSEYTYQPRAIIVICI